MAIDHIKNSTGTVLNRYTAEKEDGTSEDVKLTYNPSDDYVAGTAFAEDTINPIIDVINNNSPTLIVHASTGTEVTVACGEYSETIEATEDLATFQLSTKGTWLVSNDGKSYTVDVIDCGNYEVNFLATIMGIKFSLTSSSPAGIRTDSAEGLTFSASIGNTAGSSGFDDMPIYKDIVKRVTLDTGDVMTKIPKFYYRRYRDDSYEYWQISDLEVDGFKLHEAFDRPDGERDFIYVASYITSSNNKSATSASPTVSQTRATFRNNAKAKGSNWSQVDMATQSAIAMLMIIEIGSRDTQTLIGEGYTASSHSAKINTGSCDGVPNLTGRPAGTSNNVDVVWRGIEGLWGNVWEFRDGININNGIYYVCYNPSNFADDTASNYEALDYVGTTSWSGAYITRMGIDSNKGGILLPDQAGSGSSSTYFCDNTYSATGWRLAFVGGDWTTGLTAGLFRLNWDSVSSLSYDSVGSRLQYLPVN